MKTKVLMILIVGVLVMANIASAIPVPGIEIDFVTIGNAGNIADGTGYGAVGYEYNIGKYEVTNEQWNVFTAAAGAPTGNPSNAYDESATWTGTDVATNELSWYEAAQFCNYLTSSDKSLGAYQFSGNNTNPGDFLGIDRSWAVSAYGIAYVIPTENEWYKAAYYTGSGYSTYANGTNVAPIAGVDTNYDDVIGQPWHIDSGTMEQNGTFDMMGNVYEWIECPFDSGDYLPDSYRVARGGSLNSSAFILESSYRGTNGASPINEDSTMGFRVASVPEPGTILLLGFGGLALRKKYRR